MYSEFKRIPSNSYERVMFLSEPRSTPFIFQMPSNHNSYCFLFKIRFEKNIFDSNHYACMR